MFSAITGRLVALGHAITGGLVALGHAITGGLVALGHAESAPCSSICKADVYTTCTLWTCVYTCAVKIDLLTSLRLEDSHVCRPKLY